MAEAKQRFEVQERVAEGRCVLVHRAFDHETKREVVYKQLREDHATFPERVAAFSTASKLAARILHANLVPVMAARRVGNRIFTISPWVTGIRLLDIPRPLDVGAVAALLSQLAEAMALAHAHNTLLRGLHPRDLIVRPEGSVLLQDLNKLQEVGAAAPLPALQVRAEVFRYLPMEGRGAGSTVAIPTDIFCLGALGLELLTGVPPTPEGAVDMKPGVINALTSAGPLGLAAKVCMTLASPRADQRPKSVSSLAAQLQPLWGPQGASPRAVVAAYLGRAVPHMLPRSTPPAMPAVAARPVTPVTTPPTPRPAGAPTRPIAAAPVMTQGSLQTEEALQEFFEENTSEVERAAVMEALNRGAPPPEPARDPWGLRSAGRFRSLEDPVQESTAADQSGFAYVNESGRAILGQPPNTPARPGQRPPPGTTPRPQPPPPPAVAKPSTAPAKGQVRLPPARPEDFEEDTTTQRRR